MASARKRSWQRGSQRKSAWVVDFKDLDGRRRLMTFKTEKAAQTFKLMAEYALRVDSGDAAALRDPVGAPADCPTAETSGLLYGIPRIAAHLGLSERQAYYAAAKGHIPAFKIGKVWAARKGALDSDFAQREASAVRH